MLTSNEAIQRRRIEMVTRLGVLPGRFVPTESELSDSADKKRTHVVANWTC
jgi:hypothetical protein